MKKSKTKLIAIIIAIVLVIVAIISVLILYLTTDLFKSNQQLFLKYLAKNSQIIEEFMNDNTQESIKQIKQDKHTTAYEMTFNLESNDAQVANQSIPASNFTIKGIAKADPKNNKESSETTLKYLNNDLFTLKYIRNNDLYAIKSDEVINKYLAFDNNNLKEFAQKLGITNTGAIPNKLNLIKLQELLNISEKDKETIQEKYMQVLSLHIPKDKFKNSKNVTINVKDEDVITTEYSLELTEKETSDLLVAMLESLKTDDETLNIIFDKIILINPETTYTTDDLKNQIQGIIDELNNYMVSDGTMKLSLYVNNGELIRTQIKLDEDIVYIDYNQNDTFASISVSLESKNEETKLENSNNQSINNNEQLINTQKNNQFLLKKIDFAKQQQSNKSNIITTFTFAAGDEIAKISVQNKTDISDIIENNTTINLNLSDNTYFIAQIKSTTTPSSDLKVEDLTSDNSATMNKFSPEYISSLSQSIVKRLQTLFIQKLEFVTKTQQTITNEQTENEQNSNNNSLEENINNSENNTIN